MARAEDPDPHAASGVLRPHAASGVLRLRAAALARPLRAQGPGETVQAVEFTMAGAGCALELAWVCEVRSLRGTALLPRPAPGVLGVTHVRGRMLPLLDIAGWLGLPPADGLPEQGNVLVVGAGRPVFTFCVAQVHGLQAISPAEVAHRAAPLAATRPRAVKGMTAGGQLLLDGAFLLEAHQGRLAPGAPQPDQDPEESR